METQLVVNSNYRLEILKPGLVQAEIFGKINLDTMQSMLADRMRITNHQPFKFILFATDLLKMDKDVFTFLDSDEAKKGVLGGAIIISNSIIAQHIINTFLNFKKSNAPAKVFSNKNDALKWLNKI